MLHPRRDCPATILLIVCTTILVGCRTPCHQTIDGHCPDARCSAPCNPGPAPSGCVVPYEENIFQSPETAAEAIAPPNATESSPPSIPEPPAKPESPVPAAPVEPSPRNPLPKNDNVPNAEPTAKPLVIPDTSASTDPQNAPSTSDLIFWRRGFGADRVEGSAASGDHSLMLKRWGKARIDRRGRMMLTDGAYVVEGANDRLLEAAKAANELMVEVAIVPADFKQGGPARIVSFSADTNSRNFTLGQDRNKLVFRLRTFRNDQNGTKPEISVASLKKNRKAVHVIVTYRDGELVCYVNGRRNLSSKLIKGDLSNWSDHHLLLGDEWKRHRDWSGSVERVAIAARFINADEAKRRYKEWRGPKK